MHAKFFATLSIAVITAFTITVIYSVKSNSEDPELIKLLMLKSDAYAKYPTTDEELIKDKEFEDGYSNEQSDASAVNPTTDEELIKDIEFEDGYSNEQSDASAKDPTTDKELIKDKKFEDGYSNEQSDAYAKYPTTDEELIKDIEFEDGYSNEQSDASDKDPTTDKELIKDKKFDDGKTKENEKIYQCQENKKITAICFGSDIKAPYTESFIRETLGKNYDRVSRGLESLTKTECEKIFENNLQLARSAVDNIFEPDNEIKVSCDLAKSVLIDMAYFMGKKALEKIEGL
jgi:hypothetical protein